MDHQFDLDVDPEVIETTYIPSPQMQAAVSQIAAIDNLAFRFWCAKMLAVNLSSVTPLADAEEVVIDVLTKAVQAEKPIDGYHRIQLNIDGDLSRVGDDGEFFEPEDVDVLIFETITLNSQRAREVALIQLSRTMAVDGDVYAATLAVRLFDKFLEADAQPAFSAH